LSHFHSPFMALENPSMIHWGVDAPAVTPATDAPSTIEGVKLPFRLDVVGPGVDRPCRSPTGGACSRCCTREDEHHVSHSREAGRLLLPQGGGVADRVEDPDFGNRFIAAATNAMRLSNDCVVWATIPALRTPFAAENSATEVKTENPLLDVTDDTLHFRVVRVSHDDDGVPLPGSMSWRAPGPSSRRGRWRRRS